MYPPKELLVIGSLVLMYVSSLFLLEKQTKAFIFYIIVSIVWFILAFI